MPAIDNITQLIHTPDVDNNTWLIRNRRQQYTVNTSDQHSQALYNNFTSYKILLPEKLKGFL